MKIGFPVFRLGFLKGLGSLITLSLERGHEVVLFVDPNANTKTGEHISPEDLLAIWPAARVHVVDFTSKCRQLREIAEDVIIGLDLIDPGHQKFAFDEARAHGTRLFSVSYLYETAIRNPVYMPSLDRVFYLSDHQRLLHASLFPEVFNCLTPDWMDRYTAISGCTCSDQLAAVAPLSVRKKYNIPENVPVVLLMSLKMAVPDPWRQVVWNDGGRLRRTIHAVLQRRWDFFKDIWCSQSYRDICQEIHAFCRRHGAVLIVKSRPKNCDPEWLKELADIYVRQDEAEYPYTSMRLLAISNLCVHFESATVQEAAFASVPSLSIVVSQEHLYTHNAKYSEQLRSKEVGTMFNYPGVVYSVDFQKVSSLLRRLTLSDFRIDRVARGRYVTTFMGFDDALSSKRILDAVEASL